MSAEFSTLSFDPASTWPNTSPSSRANAATKTRPTLALLDSLPMAR
jgi:hypothetical protein